MLEGKMFLPLTGIPMRKIARIRIALADWLPEPFTVAIWRLKSLTTEAVLRLFDVCSIDPDGKGLGGPVNREQSIIKEGTETTAA